MVELRDLKPPKDIQKSEERAADRAERFLKSRLRKISEVSAEKIEKKLDKWYTAWKKQTDPQRKRLVRYSDMLEGVVADSNMPFEGSSNITLHYAAGMTRTFRASFNKTAYQDEDIFYPMPSPEMQRELSGKPEQLQALEEGFNYSFSRACNGLRTLKEGTVAAIRDGTLVVSGYWCREVRHVFDQRTYRSLEEFQKDYPNVEAAGSTDDEYSGIMDFFLAHSEPEANPQDPQGQIAQAPASLDTPELVVSFEYDHVFKDEPDYKVGPWAKFIRYPTFARDLSECQFYGYEVQESKDLVKLKQKRGEYYERGTLKALNAKVSEQADNWDKSLGYIEGLTQPQDASDKPVRYIDGCCWLDLDEDGIPEKYLVKYAPEEKALLSLTPHRLRKGIDSSVIFRLVRRENRLDGVSLIGDCEDLFNQVDVLTRHRNNVRILTTSPIFLAKNTYKEQIDLGRAENVIRPGVTYWVDDPTPGKAISQLPIQDLSATGDSMDEQQLYTRHIELVFGPTQGLSGAQTPQDPRAPAHKTQMLLMQANSRIDDYLDEFMSSLPALAEVHSALLYQYSQEANVSINRGGKLLSFPLELLAHPGLVWAAKRRSVQLTPEFAMARLSNLMALYVQLKPLLATNDPIAIELWNRQIVASGEPQADKFLLSGENLQKVQQSLQQMMQMQAPNPDAQAMASGKQAFHTEMGKTVAKHLSGQLQTTNGKIAA